MCAYALQVTPSPHLKQREKEDLAFRYLAGRVTAAHWTLNAFQKRHRRATDETPPPERRPAGLDDGLRLGGIELDDRRAHR